MQFSMGNFLVRQKTPNIKQQSFRGRMHLPVHPRASATQSRALRQAGDACCSFRWAESISGLSGRNGESSSPGASSMLRALRGRLPGLTSTGASEALSERLKAPWCQPWRTGRKTQWKNAGRLC